MDKNDQIIGKISKLEAHILKNGQSPLHRAFSLFHFNSQNQLLLQKRSQYKITFPSLWTNTGKLHHISRIQLYRSLFLRYLHALNMEAHLKSVRTPFIMKQKLN